MSRFEYDIVLKHGVLSLDQMSSSIINVACPDSDVLEIEFAKDFNSTELEIISREAKYIS